MTGHDPYPELLRTVRAAYTSHPAMMAFRPLPGDIRRQKVNPHHCPCSDAFRDDATLFSDKFAELQKAILAAGQIAHWRETYKGTDIGADFMDRFGCYCIIGENSPFSSGDIRLYMVYMPAGLYYPWHNHPAEEIYMVLSGSAVFMRNGLPNKTLREGDTSFHESNQPHAMETLDQSVLCLVAWRDQFETPPVLTSRPNPPSS